MKKNMISLNTAGSCRRLLILGITAVTLSYSQSADAAVITLTDDGMNTTISWGGSFDSTGLVVDFAIDGSILGPDPNLTTDASFVDSDDILLLDGTAERISVWNGLMGSGAFDSGSVVDGVVVVGDATGMFYANPSSGLFGFGSSADGSVELAGTLADNGFTAGQTLIMNNPNVAGASGQVVFQTSPVPEPSSTLLVGLGGVALLLRRR